MKTTLIIVFLITLLLPIILLAHGDHHLPSPITQSIIYDKNGSAFVQTEIVFDKHTSREDVIHTCAFLAKEHIQLIFDRLDIRPSFLGIAGKNRIAYVKGRIELPNGLKEQFKAGNVTAFRSVKISFSKQQDSNTYLIHMVEVVD